jgi:short subunit dehydrogenase-like uncharacterized protein
MIYGAYGYTGKLLVEEAVERGHRPILAGRNETPLLQMARATELDYRVFGLESARHIASQLSDVELVLHAAGPYTQTAAPMRQACLMAGVHYLDISGEVHVMEETFAQDALARQQGIVLIPGVGFDVVPSDCLALYVGSQLEGATDLKIVLSAGGGYGMGLSGGTIKAGFEIGARGGLVRRDGVLKSFRFGKGAEDVKLDGFEGLALPIPWGDLSTAYRSTGIPNITALITLPRPVVLASRYTGMLWQPLMQFKPVRRLAQQAVDLVYHRKSTNLAGPDGKMRIWAQARNPAGQEAAAWIETVEGYVYTAKAGVLAAETVLAGDLSGALSPAQAFGPDFALQVEGTRRYHLQP